MMKPDARREMNALNFSAVAAQPRRRGGLAAKVTLAGLLLAAGAGFGVLGGCEHRDPARVAILQANEAIGVLTADGNRLTPVSADQAKSMASVFESLKPYTSENATAAGLAARLRAGMANLDAERAADLTRQASNKLAELRSAAMAYASNSAIGETMARTDVTEQTSQTQSQLQAVRQQLAGVQAEANSAAGALATLTQQLDGLKTQAKALRDQAAALRLQAGSMSAQSGLSLVEQSAAATRQADQLDAQGLVLEAEKLTAQTQAAGLKAKADALAIEVTRLESDLQLLGTRATNDRRLSEQSMLAARARATKIAEQADAYRTLVTGDLASARSKALSGYQEALTLARSATKTGGLDSKSAQAATSSAKLAVAVASQSVADILVSQARSEEATAATMRLLATVNPPLPGRDSYAAMAETATKNFNDVLAQAREMYGQVRESLDGVSNEELKKRLSGAMSGLELLSSKQGISPEQVKAPGLDPAANDPAVAEVRKALDAYLDLSRKNDVAAVVASMRFTNPAHKDAFAGITEMGLMAAELDKLVKDKFGKNLAELPGLQMLASMSGEQMQAMRDRTGADYSISVADKIATASPLKPLGPMDPPVRLVQFDGQWMVLVDEAMGGQIAMAAPMMAPFKAVLEQLIKGLKDGSIQDETQFMAILRTATGG